MEPIGNNEDAGPESSPPVDHQAESETVSEAEVEAEAEAVFLAEPIEDDVAPAIEAIAELEAEPESGPAATAIADEWEAKKAFAPTPPPLRARNQAPATRLQIGRFETRKQLGSDDQSEVWLAHDPMFDRQVVVKILRQATNEQARSATDRILRRAKIAMGLRHPNLISIWETGRDDREDYVVSESLTGSNLRDLLKNDPQPTPMRKAVEWTRDLARALDYAHSQGVNRLRITTDSILVERREHSERCLLRDSALCTADDPHKDELDMAYASPEEAMNRPQRIGPQSDIYRLGAVLYELLTRSTPHGEHPAEIMTRHRSNRPPTAPSIRNRKRRSEPGNTRELDRICLKALEPDLDRRYSDAGSLAHDLEIWLKGGRRSAGRNQTAWIIGGSIVVAAILASIFLFFVISGVRKSIDQERERRAQQEQAQRGASQNAARDQVRQSEQSLQIQLQAARDQNYVAQMQLAQAAWNSGNAPRLLDVLNSPGLSSSDENRRSFEWRYWRRLGMNAAPLDLFWLSNGDAASAFSPNGKLFAIGGGNGEARIWDTESGRSLHILKGHQGPVLSASFSPDSTRLATASADSTIRIWSAESGQSLLKIDAPRGPIRFVAFHPDGKRLVASGDGEVYVRVWSAETGQESLAIKVEGQAANMTGIALSGSGGRVACADDAGAVRVWELESRRELTRISERASALALSHDGERLATGNADEQLRLWSAADGKPQLTLSAGDGPIRLIAFNPAGKWIAASGSSPTIQFWNAESGRRGPALTGSNVEKDGPPTTLAFSPDGKSLIAGDRGDQIHIWSRIPYEPQEFSLLATPSDSVTAMTYSPDGKRLALLIQNKTIEIWDAGTEVRLRSWDGDSTSIRGFAISPDSRQLAAFDDQGSIRIWDVESGGKLKALQAPGTKVQCASFSPNGQSLATGHDNGEIILWSRASGQILKSMKDHKSGVLALAFHPDEEILASGSADRSIKIWDSAQGTNLDTLNGHGGAVQSLAFQKSGSLLISGSSDSTIGLCEMDASPDDRRWLRRIFGVGEDVKHVGFDAAESRIIAASGSHVSFIDLRTNRSVLTLKGHEGPILALALHPEGKRLITAGADKTVRVWRCSPNIEIATIVPSDSGNSMLAASYSPNGRILAVADQRGMVRGWDSETRKELFSFQAHSYAIHSIAFAPDNERLALASGDGTVRLWSTKTRSQTWLSKKHTQSANSIAFSPNGESLISAGPDAIRLWTAATGQQTKEWEGVGKAVFSPDGKLAAWPDDEGNLKVWDLAGDKELRTIETDYYPNVIAFSPDSRRLVSGGEDSIVSMWDVSSGEEVYTCEEYGSTSLKFSADGQRFFSADFAGLLRIWDARSGKELQWLEEHADSINDLVVHPDGKRIATVSGDGSVKIWNLDTLK